MSEPDFQYIDSFDDYHELSNQDDTFQYKSYISPEQEQQVEENNQNPQPPPDRFNLDDALNDINFDWLNQSETQENQPEPQEAQSEQIQQTNQSRSEQNNIQNNYINNALQILQEGTENYENQQRQDQINQQIQTAQQRQHEQDQQRQHTQRYLQSEEVQNASQRRQIQQIQVPRNPPVLQQDIYNQLNQNMRQWDLIFNRHPNINYSTLMTPQDQNSIDFNTNPVNQMTDRAMDIGQSRLTLRQVNRRRLPQLSDTMKLQYRGQILTDFTR